MPSSTLSRQDELTQMPDAHLLDGVYELVSDLHKLDSQDHDEVDRVENEFYFLLSEAFERFAPNVELEVNRGNILTADGKEALDEYVDGLGRRHAMRLTARAERQQTREYEDG